MKKIEIIWRELLFQAIEKKKRQFTQKELAEKFSFSTSTIFQALKIPRKMGAVRVTGRFFILEDPEKLLYHWVSFRNLDNDTLLRGKVNLSISEIEGQMPPDVIFGGFTVAGKYLKGNLPADYDKVYVYSNNLKNIKQRFQFDKGRENIIVLEADPFIRQYGSITTLAQNFVDLWNMPEWYAKEYVIVLKERINGFLS